MDDKRKDTDDVDEILAELDEKYSAYKSLDNNEPIKSDNTVKNIDENDVDAPKADVNAYEKLDDNTKLEENDEQSMIDNKKRKSKNKDKKPSKLMVKWKALAKWKRATIIVVAVLLVLAIAAVGVVYGVYNGFRTAVDESNLGISTEIEEKYGSTDIFNVAIFGVDTRDHESFTGRSDSIIIVSVNKKTNEVKLTSILRDSYVAIEGHNDQKITHAYAFGGAELAIKTINQNFNMNITDYATVNFYKLAQAIDLLGGIDIYITESEMQQINDEALGGSQKGAALVNSYGDVHLDGDQTVIYARLRHYDSDDVRAQRQNNVIKALIEQAKKVSPAKYSEVVKSIMSLCETSLSFTEVMSYAPMITQELTISHITVPGEAENAIGGTYEGAWVWRYDLAAAAERIHLFIYGDVPVTTEPTTKRASKKNETTTTEKTTVPTTALQSVTGDTIDSDDNEFDNVQSDDPTSVTDAGEPVTPPVDEPTDPTTTDPSGDATAVDSAA